MFSYTSVSHNFHFQKHIFSSPKFRLIYSFLWNLNASICVFSHVSNDKSRPRLDSQSFLERRNGADFGGTTELRQDNIRQCHCCTFEIFFLGKLALEFVRLFEKRSKPRKAFNFRNFNHRLSVGADSIVWIWTTTRITSSWVKLCRIYELIWIAVW